MSSRYIPLYRRMFWTLVDELGLCWNIRQGSVLVEAPGFEPGSENASSGASTCVFRERDLALPFAHGRAKDRTSTRVFSSPPSGTTDGDQPGEVTPLPEARATPGGTPTAVAAGSLLPSYLGSKCECRLVGTCGFSGGLTRPTGNLGTPPRLHRPRRSLSPPYPAHVRGRAPTKGGGRSLPMPVKDPSYVGNSSTRPGLARARGYNRHGGFSTPSERGIP
jgi:hypothetical protein